ncbi:hypothetical protein B0A55_02060 [Friedmanniomyces simplex]|uniref:Myb-like domain-containing protein n=1 Tax=Friedmanniomyces simplex TaxID=329884 RepID=A0A4U0Y091_9PEZI|nr:hypothetical protein B0A55_02060 [Friedmanniomyces simplex]
MFTRAWLTALPDLGTVTENAHDEDELQAMALATEQEAAVSAEAEATRRESGHSGISGTTAKTSFSQEELADLDSDVIVDVLPDLVNAADQMATLLVHHDPKARPVIWKEIRIQGSRYNKLYSNRLASLSVHKRSFGSQEYIQPSIVSRALLGVQSPGEVPDGLWRPDNILFMINLAQMLRAVLVLVNDPVKLTQEGYNSLELLDAHFARTCLAVNNVNNTNIVPLTPIYAAKGERSDSLIVCLGTVTENTHDEDELQAMALAAEHEAAVSAEAEATRRESGHSGISGTTAKTSFSQEELADLDSDVIVDVLPDLVKAADQMATLLVHHDPKARPVIWKEVRIQGSRYSKLYSNRLASLSVHKRSFGSQEYIQPSIVSRALLGVQSPGEVPDGLWRPDNILFVINLAQMLRAVLVLVNDPVKLTQEGYNSLELLDAHFARCIAGPVPDTEALRMLLHIQTQLVIVRLSTWQETPQFDPIDVITDSFFKRDADGDLVYKDAETLQMQDLAEADQQSWSGMMEQLVERDLKSPFREGIPLDMALAQLRSKYKWSLFVDQVIRYYTHRSTQLGQQIAAAGGFSNILEKMSEEVQRREDARLADMKRQSFRKPGSTPRKGFGKRAIAAMKAREKRLSETSTAPPAATAPAAEAPVAPVLDPRLAATQAEGPNDVQEDDWAPQPEEQVEDQPPAQQRAGSGLDLTGFRNMQTQNAKKGKAPARFLDRQENAVRISFDDSQESQQTLPGEGIAFRLPDHSSASDPYHVALSGVPAKRPFSQVNDEPQEFDPTQDTGFQVDTRDIAAADARRKTAPRPSIQPRSRAPPASKSNTANHERPASASASPSKRQRKNPGSAIPPPMPDADPEGGNIPPEQFYERAKVLAKHGRIVATQNKPQQVRTPWLPEEENALISLIERHGGNGISYASLKRQDEDEGDVLGRRSAEDMRFKARNMKFTMMGARVPLPENWECVVLDRKAIMKLRERSFQYEQERIRQINDAAPGV